MAEDKNFYLLSSTIMLKHKLNKRLKKEKKRKSEQQQEEIKDMKKET